MARYKDNDFKEFLISCRKKIGASVTAVPVWIMQKAGKRIYTKKANRHWRKTNFGVLYKKKLLEQGKVKGKDRNKAKAKGRGKAKAKE